MIEEVDNETYALISIFYQHFIEMYGDEDLASIATAAIINDLIADEGEAFLEVA